MPVSILEDDFALSPLVDGGMTPDDDEPVSDDDIVVVEDHRAGLTGLGYDVRPSASQIISLQPGPEERLMALREALDERGVFGAPFTAPAVPAERTLLRLSVPCTLTVAQIGRVLDAAAEIRDLVALDRWPVRDTPHPTGRTPAP